MITTKLADKVKEIAKKMKELSPDIIGAMDKVEVETIDFNETKAVYDDEFIKIIKEVDVIRTSKDIDEVKEISESLTGYIRNRKWGEWYS